MRIQYAKMKKNYDYFVLMTNDIKDLVAALNIYKGAD